MGKESNGDTSESKRQTKNKMAANMVNMAVWTFHNLHTAEAMAIERFKKAILATILAAISCHLVFLSLVLTRRYLHWISYP
jgi:hypothetical protein